MRIFVDFWNLTLSCRDRAGKDYKLDWMALSPCLVAQAQQLMATQLRLEGTSAYLSYDPNGVADRTCIVGPPPCLTVFLAFA